ncbi:MAG TPA: hypothetical protein PKA63_00985 [Oligoflexia bacterium]|nr:hypothetical protein [Oligoflexia bacterium]HMP47223.1 hypothetical protein [Oligoflexia bacterium]
MPFSAILVSAYRAVPLGLPVLILYMLVEWVRFYYPLQSQQKFILDFFVLLGDAFLLHVLCIDFLSRKLQPSTAVGLKLFAHTFSALQTLPKVLLSYLGVMFLVQSVLGIFQMSPIPVLMVLIFFLWAPYLCSFENFARELSSKEIEEEDAAFDPFDEDSFSEIKKRLFTRKSWWHFGFLRSIEFTSKKGSLALSVVFLVWLARVIPDIIVGIVGDTYSSFFAVIVQVVITFFASLIVHLSIIRAILYSLQPEEREELRSEKNSLDNFEPFLNPLGIRVVSLSILVILITLLWSERRFQQGGFPDYVEKELVLAKPQGEDLLVEIRVKDIKSKLRWFSPERFRLLEKAPPRKADEKEFETSGSEAENNSRSSEGNPSRAEGFLGILSASKSTTDTSTKSQKSDPFSPILSLLMEDLMPASRVVIYDKDRKVISDHLIQPREDEIRVVLAFPRKRRAFGAPEPVYEISYISPLGFKEVLFTFKREIGVDKSSSELPLNEAQ